MTKITCLQNLVHSLRPSFDTNILSDHLLTQLHTSTFAAEILRILCWWKAAVSTQLSNWTLCVLPSYTYFSIHVLTALLCNFYMSSTSATGICVCACSHHSIHVWECVRMCGCVCAHVCHRKSQTPSTGLQHPSFNHAIFSYAIGSWKPANEQFFGGAQTVVSLFQTTQIKQGVSFRADNQVYTSTNKTTIDSFSTWGGCASCLCACLGARLLLQNY